MRTLFVIMLVMGLVLIGGGVVWPLATRLPQLNRDVQSMTEEQASLEGQWSHYQEQQQEYTELVRLFGARLTDPSTRMPRFISQLQGLCAVSEVTVASLKPLAREESEEGWIRFPVQLTVQGDLPGLVQLLYRLRRQVPLTEVERLTVRADAKNRKNLTIQMLLSSYALWEEEVWAAKEQEAAKETSTRKRTKR